MTIGLEEIPLRVAIYTRVSTLQQAREGYSLEAQENSARKYCLAHGYLVYKVYTDEGISAKDISHRAEMLKMLHDAKNGEFDIILVWSLSRFTRSVSDLYLTCEQLSHYKVSLESCTESFETRTAMGRAMLGILGVFAQLERECTAERVIAAMEERARQGKPTCCYVLGYDRNGDTLTVNHYESTIVRYIYGMYLKYKCINKVTKLCQQKGYTGKKGGLLDTESIHKILTRPIYCGYVQWHNEIYPGSHCPIIDPNVYSRVQRTILQKSISSGRRREKPLIFIPSQNEGSPYRHSQTSSLIPVKC